MSNLINISKIQKNDLEKKLRELNRKRNKKENKAFKKLTADYNYVINKIDLYQSGELIKNSNLFKEGIKYLDNPYLSPAEKLNYISVRREHLKNQLKNCTLDVFNLFF